MYFNLIYNTFMKKYSTEEVKNVFQKVFDYKLKIDKEESVACVFKPPIYKFINFDETTNTIHYQVHDKDSYNGEQSPFYYDEKITLEQLIERFENIK